MTGGPPGGGPIVPGAEGGGPETRGGVGPGATAGGRTLARGVGLGEVSLFLIVRLRFLVRAVVRIAKAFQSTLFAVVFILGRTSAAFFALVSCLGAEGRRNRRKNNQRRYAQKK